MFTTNIKYTEKESYLHAKVSGTDSDVETAIEYWKTIMQECACRNYSKLLVERNFPIQLDVFDIRTITRHIASLSLKFKIKLAYVENEVSRPGANEYGEDAVQEAGVIARLFNTIKEAEEWLKNLN